MQKNRHQKIYASIIFGLLGLAASVAHGDSSFNFDTDYIAQEETCETWLQGRDESGFITWAYVDITAGTHRKFVRDMWWGGYEDSGRVAKASIRLTVPDDVQVRGKLVSFDEDTGDYSAYIDDAARVEIPDDHSIYDENRRLNNDGENLSFLLESTGLFRTVRRIHGGNWWRGSNFRVTYVHLREDLHWYADNGVMSGYIVDVYDYHNRRWRRSFFDHDAWQSISSAAQALDQFYLNQGINTIAGAGMVRASMSLSMGDAVAGTIGSVATMGCRVAKEYWRNQANFRELHDAVRAGYREPWDPHTFTRSSWIDTDTVNSTSSLQELLNFLSSRGMDSTVRFLEWHNSR